LNYTRKNEEVKVTVKRE